MFYYRQGKTRLEYAHVENRPFHILLLKQLHMLSNKVCHRTALEIAKLMLNLDPSDPLGVILIVDMMAVRAREYAWILAIYEQWETERDGRRLFHLLYSRALAKYQVYLKSKLSGKSLLHLYYSFYITSKKAYCECSLAIIPLHFRPY